MFLLSHLVSMYKFICSNTYYYTYFRALYKISTNNKLNFFVCLLGAILLSLYYLFLWNPYKDAPTGTLKLIPTPSAQAKNAPGT